MYKVNNNKLSKIRSRFNKLLKYISKSFICIYIYIYIKLKEIYYKF